MARRLREGGELVYAAAEQFKLQSLQQGGSLFTPGVELWTPETIAELEAVFVDAPDATRRSFLEKLKDQLSGVSDEARQLMAELLYFHLLIVVPTHIGGDRKREVIVTALGAMDDPVEIPVELDAALDFGLAWPGMFFNMARDVQVRWLIAFAHKWSAFPPSTVEQLLADPWAFKREVYALPVASAWLQRSALLHLVFPSTFESIMLRDDKYQVVRAFADRIGGTERAESLDEDRALLEIREALTQEYGPDFDFYLTPEVVAAWRDCGADVNTQDRPPLIEYVEALYPGWSGFDDPRYLQDEREYKDKARRLASELLGRDALEELLAEGQFAEIAQRVEKVGKSTNLLWFQVPRDGDLAVLYVTDFDPEAFARAVYDLLYGSDDSSVRLQRFADFTLARKWPTKWALPTYLLMLVSPSDEYFVKPLATKWMLDQLGSGAQLATRANGADYAGVLETVRELEAMLQPYGPKDLVDVQGYVWIAYRNRDELGDAQAVTPPLNGAGADARDIYATLAAANYHFPDWLVTDYLLSLATKPLAILSGISGTGKTKLAQLVAEVCAPSVDVVVETGQPDVPEDGFMHKVGKSTLKYGRITVPKSAYESLPPIDRGKQIPVRLSLGDEEFEGWVANVGFADVTREVVQIYLRQDFKEWLARSAQRGDFLVFAVSGDEDHVEFAGQLVAATREVRKASSDRVAFLSVRPDWTDNRALLGYYNPLVQQYQVTPLLRLLLRAQSRRDEMHFVVLDEMNLAKVEYYFSDFLSAMESGTEMTLHDAVDELTVEDMDGVAIPRGISVPPNVMFTGTVNVDETTYMFSPKVLDRANTIEFNEVNLETYSGGGGRAEDGAAFRLSGVSLEALLKESRRPEPGDWVELDAYSKSRVVALNEVLQGYNLHFGYRVANEIARYVTLSDVYVGEGARDTALDLQILQKVLPKLSGSKAKLEAPLWRLLNWAYDPDEGVESLSEAALESIDPREAVYPRSARKLQRMLRQLRESGFVSFVE